MEALTRSSIVPTEELAAWKTAQEGNPVLRQIIHRIHASIERNTFQINVHGLLVRIDASDGSVKLMVPSSMKEKVIQYCHDVPVAGHVGIHSTQELVNRQFCWRGWGPTSDIMYEHVQCAKQQRATTRRQQGHYSLSQCPQDSGSR